MSNIQRNRLTAIDANFFFFSEQAVIDCGNPWKLELMGHASVVDRENYVRAVLLRSRCNVLRWSLCFQLSTVQWVTPATHLFMLDACHFTYALSLVSRVKVFTVIQLVGHLHFACVFVYKMVEIVDEMSSALCGGVCVCITLRTTHYPQPFFDHVSLELIYFLNYNDNINIVMFLIMTRITSTGSLTWQ